MNETQPTQGSPSPYKPGGDRPPAPKPEPCDDPKPTEPEPCPDPPTWTCPEPPPCPDPPVKPCPPKAPDPCAEPPDQKPPDLKPPDPYKPTEPPKPPDPYKPGDPTKPTDPTKPKDATKPTDPYKPTDPTKLTDPTKPDPSKPKPSPCADGAKGMEQQLAKYLQDLDDAKRQLQDLDKAKAHAAALEQQINSLKDTIKAQKTANDDYKTFYNQTQVDAKKAASYIQTVRCQLSIPDKKCVEQVIAEGWMRVKQAREARDTQKQKLADAEQLYARRAFELDYYKGLYELFKSNLKKHALDVLSDLTKLTGLADPTKKDHCETEFYLTEMEWHLRSEHCRPGTSPECYNSDLRLGTLLDCWGPDCYCVAIDRAVVDYNAAVVAEKDQKTTLEAEKAKLKDLEEALKNLEKNRRDWVVAELKTRGCCKPKDKAAAV